jgi:hypothetical protein
LGSSNTLGTPLAKRQGLQKLSRLVLAPWQLKFQVALTMTLQTLDSLKLVVLIEMQEA